MSTYTLEVAQVAGGKFHRLANPEVPRAQAWKPARTACGRTVAPLNHFETQEDALRYCGGRRELFCAQCNFDKEAQP